MKLNKRLNDESSNVSQVASREDELNRVAQDARAARDEVSYASVTMKLNTWTWNEVRELREQLRVARAEGPEIDDPTGPDIMQLPQSRFAAPSVQ